MFTSFLITRPLASVCPWRCVPEYWNTSSAAAFTPLAAPAPVATEPEERPCTRPEMKLFPPPAELATFRARPMAESQLVFFFGCAATACCGACGMRFVENEPCVFCADEAANDLFCLYTFNSTAKSSAFWFSKSTAKRAASTILSSCCVA